MKKLSKKSKLILKSYSESASEASEKLEVLDPMIKKLREESEGEVVNFSAKSKSSLRKLMKKFSETEEALEDASYDADQLEEVSEELGDKSVERKVKMIKKEFADLTNKFNEFKDEVKKVSEISASVNDDKLSVTEGVAPKVPTEDENDAVVDKKESINKEVPTDDEDEKIAKLDTKESITNFSKFMKGKLTNLLVKFSEVVDSMENITDLSEDLDESLKDETEEDKELESEDMKNFSTKLAPNGTYAEAIALTNFNEEITKKLVEVVEENELGEDAKEKIEECFSELGEALDEVCKNYCDETANMAIEKIEKCKDCVSEFSKKCKFSVKKKVNSIMKEFAQVDSLIDEVSEKVLSPKDVKEIPSEEAFAKFCEEIKNGEYTEDEVVEFCNKFCEATGTEVVPKDVMFADEELNECIDDLDKVERRIEDKSIVEFSKRLRAKLKTIKCFSQENLDAKSEVSGELAEFLDEKVENSEEFSITEENVDKIPENLEKANQELNDKIDKLSEVEEKVSDEGIKNFAKKLLKAMKSMKCFSQDDLDAKSEAVAEVSESLDQAIEDQTESDANKEEPVTENFEACPECGATPCECKKDEEVTEEVDTEFSDDQDETEKLDTEEDEVEKEEITNEDEKVEEVKETTKSSLMDLDEDEEEKIDESIANFSKESRDRKTSYASILGL